MSISDNERNNMEGAAKDPGSKNFSRKGKIDDLNNMLQRQDQSHGSQTVGRNQK